MGLDSVELVIAVEEHFGITIPDKDASTLVTVGKLHNWVVKELHRLNRSSVAETGVFGELRQLISDELGVVPERIVHEARFVQDLQID